MGSMATQQSLWVYTTWPDRESARTAARTLIGEKLCACANLLPEMESLYPWEGELQEDRECAMILKTTGDNGPALRDRVIALHPYTEPCVLALPTVSEVNAPGYSRWLAATTER